MHEQEVKNKREVELLKKEHTSDRRQLESKLQQELADTKVFMENKHQFSVKYVILPLVNRMSILIFFTESLRYNTKQKWKNLSQS